jgi:hypothetical protein
MNDKIQEVGLLQNRLDKLLDSGIPIANGNKSGAASIGTLTKHFNRINNLN